MPTTSRLAFTRAHDESSCIRVMTTPAIAHHHAFPDLTVQAFFATAPVEYRGPGAGGIIARMIARVDAVIVTP
jgi:hypothetical protein